MQMDAMSALAEFVTWQETFLPNHTVERREMKK